MTSFFQIKVVKRLCVGSIFLTINVVGSNLRSTDCQDTNPPSY